MSEEPVVEITLPGGYIALADLVDIDLLDYHWSISHRRHTHYAVHTFVVSGAKVLKSMHRLILERVLGRPLGRKEEVDHINGNGLDNRRSNLRLASHPENCRNRRPIRRRNASETEYKGVHRRGRGWRAWITVDRTRHYLGVFETPRDAAIAYNHAAVALHKEFASLNDIPGWQGEHPRHRKPFKNIFKGVSFLKDRQKWRASITVAGKTTNLGEFCSPEEAREVYLEAVRHHFGENSSDG
jgi:hypothetical protein